MATGLEALGAASACLQLISFAANIIQTCKKVYEGRPTSSDHLGEHVRRMMGAVDRVQSRCKTMAEMQPTNYDKKLDDIAGSCSAAARELEDEVRYLTQLQEKSSLLKSINATLRASRHRKKLELLELSLSRNRQVMEVELFSHLW